MSKLKNVGMWFKRNWKWFAATVSLLASLFVLFFIKDDLKSLMIQKKRVSIKKKNREIEALKLKKARIEGQIDFTEDQVKEVDDLIASIYKEIDEDVAEIAALTTNEKLEKFDDLGY